MKQNPQFILCFVAAFAYLAGIKPVQAISIATADPYDATIDAKSRAIAEDVKISDYREESITAPGVDVPIGLDVSFKLTQTLGNSFALSLERQPSFSLNFGSQFACYPTDSLHTGYTYNINGDTERVLRYHCMPGARQWDKDKQTIESAGGLMGEAPPVGAKAHAMLSIAITNPNCKSFIPNPPRFHTDYECLRYTQNITSKLPVKLLDDATFWYTAAAHTTQQALEADGYRLCGMSGLYCRLSPETLAKVTISHYEEKPYIFPGFSAPIGLFVDFDVTQKGSAYTALDFDLEGGRYPLASCNALNPGSKGEQEFKNYTQPPIIYGGAAHENIFPLQPDGTTRVHYLCGTRMHGSVGKNTDPIPMDEKTDAPRVFAFLHTNADAPLSGNGLEIADKVKALLPADAKLLQYHFWLATVNRLGPDTYLDAGYTNCVDPLAIGFCPGSAIKAGNKSDIPISHYREDSLILEPVKTPAGLIINFDIKPAAMERGTLVLHALPESPMVCKSIDHEQFSGGAYNSWPIMGYDGSRLIHVTYVCQLKGIHPVLSPGDSYGNPMAEYEFKTQVVMLDTKKIKEFANDAKGNPYKMQLLLRGEKSEDNYDITDSLLHALPKSAQLLEPSFWQILRQTITPTNLTAMGFYETDDIFTAPPTVSTSNVIAVPRQTEAVTLDETLPAKARIFKVTVDTSALGKGKAKIDFQLNGGLAESKRATAIIRNFTIEGGTVSDVQERNGETSGQLPDGITITSTKQLNDVLQGITLGRSLSFEVEFSGDAITHPGGSSGNSFAVSLYSQAETLPLLTTNPVGSVLTLDINTQGEIHPGFISPAVHLLAVPGVETDASQKSASPPPFVPNPAPKGTINFIPDPASTVAFNPVQYEATIDRGLIPSNFSIFLTDHGPEENRLHLSYFPSLPKTPHESRRDIIVTFKGKPILNKEYRFVKLVNTMDWRRSDFALDNEDGSAFANSSSFALPGTPGVAIKEIRATYLALPQKAGDELSVKIEIIFQDGTYIRGVLNAPVKEASPGM